MINAHSSRHRPKKWGKLKPAARQMRYEPTGAEAVLWRRIRNRRVDGARFRRQHAIESFIVDFVCIEQRLIVEVDGDIHDQAEQQVYDVQRQEFLEEHGFRVLRFTNAEVLHSLETVAEIIGEALRTQGS